MIPTKRIPPHNHSIHEPVSRNVHWGNAPEGYESNHIRTDIGIRMAICVRILGDVIIYARILGYEWPFTQVKTWAYG